MLDLAQSEARSDAISLFIDNGYGKGTLSRNYPDFSFRNAEGLEGATRAKPFAVPRRIRLRSNSDSPSNFQNEGNPKESPSISPSFEDSVIEEEFQFGYEEAVYLSHQLGAISVVPQGDERPLTSVELWHILKKCQQSLVVRYYGTV